MLTDQSAATHPAEWEVRLESRPGGAWHALGVARMAGEAGGDIRTVQELLGHKDVAPTMLYTHVLNRGPAGVQSPADRVLGG